MDACIVLRCRVSLPLPCRYAQGVRMQAEHSKCDHVADDDDDDAPKVHLVGSAGVKAVMRLS
jgi:hypothetical protein